MEIQYLTVFTKKVNDLFFQQLSEWELAKTNYEQLKSVKTKRIGFGDFDVLVQFNPERIRSSAARVDARSVEARPCFLCKENRPAEQRDLPFNKEYTILVNPYPIFHRHLTIANNVHIDQRIRNNFSEMLSMTKSLHGFIVFYNGPQCGASAPDHLHFQAGERGFLPLETDFQNKKLAEKISEISGTEIWLWKNYHRGIITLKGKESQSIEIVFNDIYDLLTQIQPDYPEPMLNILAYHDPGGYIIHIIPRKIHRPSYFYEVGNNQILVSPASVDLAGMIIIPREEDFKRLNKFEVTDIFTQVCFNETDLNGLINGHL